MNFLITRALSLLALAVVPLCAFGCSRGNDGTEMKGGDNRADAKVGNNGTVVKERPVEWVTLEVAGPSNAADKNIVCPPPGVYKMCRGDSMVLHAYDRTRPQCPPLWSGAANGNAVSVPVLVDGPSRVAVAFDGPCAAASAPEAPYAAPQTAALQTLLGSGDTYGWFLANRRDEHLGAGMVTLVSADEPFYSVFNRPNLNFEHIINGAAQDAWRAVDTPRTDPMQVRVLSPSCVEVRWPAESSSWKLDCAMRYSFVGRNAVDMEFEVTPRRNEAPRGYLVFMWASYMRMARERMIHFPGVRDGAEGWVSFGNEGESGTVAGRGQAALDGDPNADGMKLGNIHTVEGVQFTEPVYYGLVDGDQNMETAEDAMAFIMMFDDAATTRFAIWNWGDNPYASAWDWQYVLRAPEVGKTCRHRSRLVLKPFAGQEDVLAEYHAWRARLDGKDVETALPLEKFPVILSPGEDKQDPVALGDALCAQDPARALLLYRQALRIALLRLMAATQIDALFKSTNDSAGRVVFWKSVAGEEPGNAIAWEHLGRAHAASGDPAAARTAWEKALQCDPGNTEVRGVLQQFNGAASDKS